MLNCKNTALIDKLKQLPEYEQIASLLRQHGIYESQIFDISNNAILFNVDLKINGNTVNALIRNNCAGEWNFCRAAG